MYGEKLRKQEYIVRVRTQIIMSGLVVVGTKRKNERKCFLSKMILTDAERLKNWPLSKIGC